MTEQYVAPMLALLLVSVMLFAGCAQDADAVGDTVTIGSYKYSETLILGEMAKILIEEHTDLKAENIGTFEGSHILHTATVSGDLDMYANWTGTQFTGVLEMEVTEDWRDNERVYEYCREQFEKQFNQTWLPPLGFNNTYALKMRRDDAEELGIETISDLRGVDSEIVVGTDANFQEREGDGYNAFTDHYDLEFADAIAMEIGLMYRAVDAGDVDCIVAYATDGRTAALDLKVLEDDMGFFPPYDGGFVVRQQLLDAYPEVEEALSVLWGHFDDERMAGLNARVDVHEEEYQDVAREYLEKMGWID